MWGCVLWVLGATWAGAGLYTGLQFMPRGDRTTIHMRVEVEAWRAHPARQERATPLVADTARAARLWSLQYSCQLYPALALSRHCTHLTPVLTVWYVVTRC